MKIFKEMDTNQFWLTLWSMVITGVMLITTAISISVWNEDRIVQELINAGHSPLEVKCLFNSASTSEAMCIILAQAKVK
jgi:hypothetical protein